jgi:serine protease Do
MMNAATLMRLLFTIAALGLATGRAGAANGNLDLARQLNQAFIEVAEKVSPSVVVITVTEKAKALPALDDEELLGEDAPDQDFWRRFHQQFRDQMPEKIQGQGSGVIIRKNGYILTNRHVVADAEEIVVRLLDGRTFKAGVRGVDPQSDVAVIKIEADDLPVANLANSSNTRVGEFAIAIGAPFNLDYTVTYGHVSAKGRSNVIPGSEGATMDQDFIQTDANINPGNSGGPLVNIEGEVIGINTLIRGLRTGIGFAIPSNLAREVSDKLIEDGKFTRSWLGVEIQSLRENPEFREIAGGVKDGVIVRAILPNGPASKSDLRPTDIITAVDGKSVSTPQQLRSEVRGKTIGQIVKLDVHRGGKDLQVSINPGEYQDTPVMHVESKAKPAEPAPAGLGITVQQLTSELAGQYNVSATAGVIVVSVQKNSPASRKGIKAGDVITGINQKTVTTPKHFTDALKNADLKKGVIVNYIANEVARFEILNEAKE